MPDKVKYFSLQDIDSQNNLKLLAKEEVLSEKLYQMEGDSLIKEKNNGGQVDVATSKEWPFFSGASGVEINGAEAVKRGLIDLQSVIHEGDHSNSKKNIGFKELYGKEALSDANRFFRLGDFNFDKHERGDKKHGGGKDGVATPEPATWALLAGMGLCSYVSMRKRAKAKA